jgi:hypothetical protein
MSLLITHEILAAMLFYTCFCRAVKTNGTVRVDVLIALWFLGIVSCVSMFAPMAFGWEPDLMSVMLLLGMVIVQVVTAAHWRDGIPKEFVDEGI